MNAIPISLRSLLYPLLSLALLLVAPMLQAEEEHRTTVVFFADKPMPDAQWSTLFAAIQDELHTHSSEWTGMPKLDLMRGDRVRPGLVVDDAISVYLHGDCASVFSTHTPNLSSSPHPGALGWVELTNGKIEPFIHIDCSLIEHVLFLPSHFTAGSPSDRVSLAVARVFLHEWLHVSTQNPHHAHSGIAKSEFTTEDLIGHAPHRPQTGQSLIGTAHGK